MHCGIFIEATGPKKAPVHDGYGNPYKHPITFSRKLTVQCCQLF